MSASQLTPRANPALLPPEKSLPPSPSSPSSPTSTSYSANTLKALPARPTCQRSRTQLVTSASGDSIKGSLLLPQLPRSLSSEHTATSFLEVDPYTPKRSFFDTSAPCAFMAQDPHPEQNRQGDGKYSQKPMTGSQSGQSTDFTRCLDLASYCPPFP